MNNAVTRQFTLRLTIILGICLMVIPKGLWRSNLNTRAISIGRPMTPGTLIALKDTWLFRFSRLAWPECVLIVDDNASIRQALCELFEREADFEVCGEAENEKVAIEKAQELRPDLIVLDLSMPVMNGFEAARVLKRLVPTVPLIMFRAFGDEFAEHQARLIGVSEVVSKSEQASVPIHKARNLLYSTAA